MRGDRDSLCSAFKLAKNGHRERDAREGRDGRDAADIPKPNITFGPPAPNLPPAAASPNLFPFNLYHNLFNGSAAAGLLGSSLGAAGFNPMLALAAQHSPLLASAYASLGVTASGNGVTASHVDRLRPQPRFSPFENSNGSAFETVLPRGVAGGGGVSPPTHRPPLSPASVCSSTSSFHQTSSDLMSIERMVKGIDGVKSHLSDDQVSEKGGCQSPRSDSH